MSQTADEIIIQTVNRTVSTDDPSNCALALNVNLSGKYHVKSLTLCNSMYNIDSTNNTILFYENATAKSATITAGFYTSTNIAAAVKTALDTASGGHNTFTVSYSSSTGKLTISAGNAFYFRWASDADNTCYRELGFQKANTASGTSITAPCCLNLNACNQLLLNISNAHASYQSTSYTQGNVLIPLEANGLEFKTYYFNRDIQQCVQFDTNAKRITLTLRDDLGRIRSLNGTDYSLVLSNVGLS